MALACPRCGTQNPDGNAYCQACGTPLAAPAAVTAGAYAGPPPGLAPPPPSPGYQSPYYAPSGAPVQVHRTPWMLIVAVVLAATVLMAGAGTALALLGNRTTQTPSSSGLADIPSPTPGVTPSPVASPTTTTQVGLQSNDGFTVNVPSGWSVDSKDNETMVLTDPNGGGSVTVSSGESVPTQTAQNNKDTVDSALKSKYPDTRECPNTSPANGTLNGAPGISWTVCFTLTSGANSVPAAASVFAGANTSGSVYYLVMVLTTASNLSAYVNAAKPVVSSVHWKLS
jgi:zinc ribbon protein